MRDGEHRTIDQLREHYEIERELAARLRSAPSSERGLLYPKIYDELFRRVPLHPQWTKKNPSVRDLEVRAQITSVRRYLRPDQVILELGAGDCAFSIAASAFVKQSYALDVSSALLPGGELPSNFEFVGSDGVKIDLPSDSINFVYSYQLMEHIHPDDARSQLREIRRVLRPGGHYYCSTPNRLSGPHDISQYFDETSTGLHLKEYSVSELSNLFGSVGFQDISAERMLHSHLWCLPVWPLRTLEMILDLLPVTLRKQIGRSWLVARAIDFSVVARKVDSLP